MVNGNDESTIRISKKMKRTLAELGTLSDTYESVIAKLVDHYKKTAKVRVRKNGAP